MSEQDEGKPKRLTVTHVNQKVNSLTAEVESLRNAEAEDCKNLDGHVENLSMHMTRRQNIKDIAIVVGGLWFGGKMLGAWWEHRKKFKPKFVVNIFSDEELESSSLSEEQRELIAKSSEYPDIYGRLNGYTEIGFDTNKGLAKADIKYNGNLLAKDIHEGEMLCIEREVGEEKFVFVAEAPEFKKKKIITVRPNFLKNEELLAKIVEADKIKREDEDKVDNHFSYFYMSSFSWGIRDYYGFNIPTECKIQVRRDCVSYDVNGLEALTDGDKNLFAEYWIRRSDFDGYGNFKEMHDFFADIRGKIGNSLSMNSVIKGGALKDIYRENQDKFGSYKEFMKEYDLFAGASNRIKGAEDLEAKELESIH